MFLMLSTTIGDIRVELDEEKEESVRRNRNNEIMRAVSLLAKDAWRARGTHDALAIKIDFPRNILLDFL